MLALYPDPPNLHLWSSYAYRLEPLCPDTHLKILKLLPSLIIMPCFISENMVSLGKYFVYLIKIELCTCISGSDFSLGLNSYLPSDEMPFLRAPSALLTHLPGHFAASAEIVS
jgi:hypothetical protein